MKNVFEFFLNFLIFRYTRTRSCITHNSSCSIKTNIKNVVITDDLTILIYELGYATNITLYIIVLGKGNMKTLRVFQNNMKN